MDDFIWRALLAGCGIALLCAPMGSFIVWRRMSYFGETMAHGALLGASLGLLWQLPLTLAILGSSLFLALVLQLLKRQQLLATDTLLGILSHIALAAGIVMVSLLSDLRVDIMAFLFGDILAVQRIDLWWIWIGGGVLLIILRLIWQPLLSITVHPELARVEGVNVQRTELIFMLLIATVIALAIKIIGILLITSLLIIPAATARRFSHTPEQMVGFALLFSLLSVGSGLFVSWHIDLPAGPAIVLGAGSLFMISLLIKPRLPG